MGADDQAAAVAHGVDGVGDEVVEDLADVVFEAEDGSLCGVVCLDTDAGVAEAALVEIEDGIDELVGGDVGAGDGLAVEAEGLGSDLGDTGELGLRHVDVDLEVRRKALVERDEIEQIGDGFERVIDLVGDGAGEATDGGELLALHESGLGALLLRDVE